MTVPSPFGSRANISISAQIQDKQCVYSVSTKKHNFSNHVLETIMRKMGLLTKNKKHGEISDVFYLIFQIQALGLVQKMGSL